MPQVSYAMSQNTPTKVQQTHASYPQAGEKPGILESALAGHEHAPIDWMPASGVRPLIFEDPALVWLKYHGAAHGFQPDTSPYNYADFLAAKSHQFEQKWLHEMAPDAVTVCRSPEEGSQAAKVRETWDLMQRGAPVIAQPALWWAPERIYGVPDVLAQSAWLRDHLPGLLNVEDAGPDHYVVIDLKFTTKIEESGKARDRQSYAAQVRLYSYMLGCLQGVMPQRAWLVTRDRLADPFPVEIISTLPGALDPDLTALRDHFIEIKVNGARYLPWRDAIVASNIDNADERWQTAKQVIAAEKTPGRDPALVYQIGAKAQRELATMGYPSLASLLQRDPATLPLESIKGIGAVKAGQIRAVLAANRSGRAALPPPQSLPPQKPNEFFVDFEYFANVDVDFERQWPTLEGCEIVFMIGVGWEEDGNWRYQGLVAEAEHWQAERMLFERFVDLLRTMTSGALTDPSRTVLYHWTNAEVWQTRRAADRMALTPTDPLRHLPWYDLQKTMLNGPVALPGALAYGLKDIAAAVGLYAPDFATRWPDELDEGLNAMVMGWKAYQQPRPLQSQELAALHRYLEADCAALRNILLWLRFSSEPHDSPK